MHTKFQHLEHEPITFASDLIPGICWIHLPVCMGYDRSPELLIEEKKTMLEGVISENGRLFYTHDPEVALSGINFEEGKFVPVAKMAEFSHMEL